MANLPMFNRLRFPALLFFGASLLGLLQVYYFVGGSKLRLSLSALGYGLALGFFTQLFFRQSLPKLRVCVASFGGAFTLWLPVVLVTYGFALTATPVFVAYAVAVVLGIFAASRMRKDRAPEDPPTIPSSGRLTTPLKSNV